MIINLAGGKGGDEVELVSGSSVLQFEFRISDSSTETYSYIPFHPGYSSSQTTLASGRKYCYTHKSLSYSKPNVIIKSNCIFNGELNEIDPPIEYTSSGYTKFYYRTNFTLESAYMYAKNPLSKSVLLDLPCIFIYASDSLTSMTTTPIGCYQGSSPWTIPTLDDMAIHVMVTIPAKQNGVFSLTTSNTTLTGPSVALAEFGTQRSYRYWGACPIWSKITVSEN